MNYGQDTKAPPQRSTPAASQDARAVRQAAAALAARDRERRARCHAHARGLVVKSAAAEYGVDPRTVVKLGGSALSKTKGGRYAAKSSDTLFRPFVVTVHGGRIEVGVRGSRAASELSKRAIAQREFLATGDDTKLRKLRKTKILDASGREIPFLTDEGELARQGDLGMLSYESIYARRG